jgi:2-polyprenyl-6-methoxyphenol hydroxylase-like FAD-dependent oxidoreductase
VWFFHRPELLQTLYGQLAEVDRARIKTSKEVTSIETLTHGVKVICTDDTHEEGSIVIGADGAHSIVRQMMRVHALQESPSAPVNSEKPFPAAFRAMWGTIPMVQDSMTPGEAWECHGPGLSSQLFLGRGRGWFVVHEKLAKPSNERRIYSQRNMDEHAKRLAELPMTNSVLFRDIYAVSHSCGMSDIGEGTLKRFSWDRMVLVGGAATQQALGFNSGVQDVMALTNALRQLILETHHDLIDSKPLADVLHSYESARRSEVLQSAKTSARGIRMRTWDNRGLWLLDRYILHLK